MLRVYTEVWTGINKGFTLGAFDLPVLWYDPSTFLSVSGNKTRIFDDTGSEKRNHTMMLHKRCVRKKSRKKKQKDVLIETTKSEQNPIKRRRKKKKRKREKKEKRKEKENRGKARFLFNLVSNWHVLFTSRARRRGCWAHYYHKRRKRQSEKNKTLSLIKNERKKKSRKMTAKQIKKKRRLHVCELVLLP